MSQRSVDTLVVGAGIAGLLLARELRRRGQRVVVAHDPAGSGASEAAVGLLNPVRGRRCTLAWRAQEVFACARETYDELSVEAGHSLARRCEVIRAFASDEERRFLERRAAAIEEAGFALRPCDAVPDGWRGTPLGAVVVHGAASVDVCGIVARLRAELRAADALVEQRCEQLAVGDGSAIEWPAAGVRAGRVVLAAGAGALGAGPADALPLRPVHGESLLVRIAGQSPSAAFVCGHHLAPLGEGLWSCGGTKVPGDASCIPTIAGRAELEAFLQAHVTQPWEILAHRAGVRAVTMDTKPFVGRTGDDPRLHVFNGFGSQGYAIGPWLARLMAEHLVSGAPLPPEVDPQRFAPPARPADATRWHAVDVARQAVLRQLAPGDLAIDLTVGHGGDTLALAQAVGADGAVLGLDIQEHAIQSASRRLSRATPDADVEVRCADHAELEAHVPGSWRGRVGAIVASLGRLPGSDSPVATTPAGTIAAFTAALPFLRPQGVLVAVIPVRHPGGVAELGAVEQWAAGLDPDRWQVRWQRAPDRSPRAPVVLAVLRA